jgi:hypothetical protein
MGHTKKIFKKKLIVHSFDQITLIKMLLFLNFNKYIEHILIHNN